jgi:hypothetical protein
MDEGEKQRKREKKKIEKKRAKGKIEKKKKNTI